MKTTKEWWKKVSNSEEEMINWLKAQYHGEVTAANRIKEACKKYKLKGVKKKLILSIISDEKLHASWVKKLLISRGVCAKILKKEERYWNEVLSKELEENNFKYFCAVAYHAETMRLDRINLLASDKRFEDIAKVFMKIQPDEIFHARIFKELSDKNRISKALKYHKLGMNAIGLLP